MLLLSSQKSVGIPVTILRIDTCVLGVILSQFDYVRELLAEKSSVIICYTRVESGEGPVYMDRTDLDNDLL
jgi:hypothetical protein